MREFDTGATRDDSVDKLDYEGFLCPLALERYAQYMHAHRKQADGKVRASDNWQKGLPIEECVKSLLRHLMDLWKLNRGYSVSDQKDGHFISMEEACCAMIFNNFSILSTLEGLKARKLINMPGPDPYKFKKMVDESCDSSCPSPVQCDHGMENTILPPLDALNPIVTTRWPPTQYGGDE